MQKDIAVPYAKCDGRYTVRYTYAGLDSGVAACI